MGRWDSNTVQVNVQNGNDELSMYFSYLLKISLLEKEMATHSSILTWISPWTEEPGGL